MSISSLSVIAALTILNLTVFLLKPDNSVPDPPSTMVPGIIAFSVTGSIFLLMLSGVLLSAIAVRAFTTLKGVRAVVSAMYGSVGGHADALKVWLPV
jgi:Cu/Ag efflux pump CusA